MHFPEWKLPTGIFPSGNFPQVVFRVATSHRYFPELQLPTGFSRAATSHVYFHELQLPTGIFPSCNFPQVFLRAATSPGIFPSGNFSNEQLYKLQLPKCDQAAALCPLAYPSSRTHCSLRRLKCPQPNLWEVAAWKITWEVTLGKMPKGKYITYIGFISDLQQFKI